jgi:acetyl-CoA carboxylase carboxyl transferase subunit beta
MDKILRKRRKQLNEFKAYLGKNTETKAGDIPDGLYTKCPTCSELIVTDHLLDELYVCPECGHHFYIPSQKRLTALFDEGKYHEYYKNMRTKDPLHFPEYDKKLEKGKRATGMNDGVLVATGRIGGVKCVVCVMDNHFMMASMGTVAGEKLTRAIEMATKRKRPLIIFSSSGGARMQEGIFSLFQMEKTVAALHRHLEAGLLYISYLTHPTTGGVTASFAMLGDINIAEPEALIGFAGPRVIESTMKQKLPEGFQRSEFLEDHGFVDLIVERKDMRKTLIDLLHLHE